MLSKQARRLLSAQVLFNLGNAFSGIFTSVYLWRLKPGVMTPAIYNAWAFAACLVGFPLLGKYFKRIGAEWALAIGNLLYAGFYLTLLILGDRAINHLADLGVFYGFAMATYYIAEHVLTYDLTDDSNRERYYSLKGFFTSSVGTTVPFISGWVIAALPGLRGYTVIFIISLIAYTASAAFSFSLRTQPKREPYQIWRVLPGKDRRWWRILAAQGMLGVRDGVFFFISNLLVFIISGSEASVGTFNLVVSLAGIAAFGLAARVMTAENRRKMFFIGTLGVVAASSILGVGLNWVTVMVYGVLNAISQPFFHTAQSAINFRVFSEISGDSDLRTELVCAREVPLGLGRLSGLVAFMWLGKDAGQSTEFIQFLAPALGLFVLGAWLAQRKLLPERA